MEHTLGASSERKRSEPRNDEARVESIRGRPDLGRLDLRRGMREDNRQVVRSAYEKLLPLIMEWADADESVKDFFARGPWAIHYAQAASEAMAKARPVMWWNAKRKGYQFAFFCEDWKSAFFLSVYLEHMRVCPCGQIFVPAKSNIWYCKPQHSAYYRLKRWRQRRKKRPQP